MLSNRYESIQGPLADYVNNNNEFRILDNASNTNTTTNTLNSSTVPQEEDRCCCYDNNNSYYPNSNRLTIRQFTKYYTTVYSSHRFDNKRSPNIAHFGKISLIKSNLTKFDNKDTITKNIEIGKASNIVHNEELRASPSYSSDESSSLIPCNHYNYQGKSENEVLVHSVNAHQGKPARPDPDLLIIIQQKNNSDKMMPKR